MSKQQPFFFYPISVSFTASSKIVVLTVDGVIVSKIGTKASDESYIKTMVLKIEPLHPECVCNRVFEVDPV